MTVDALAVISDAIKILGPALITAYVAYKATKAQMTLKLKEMDKSHEFGARKYIYNHYKERSRQLLKSYEGLNNGLGTLMGYTIGYSLGDKENAAEFMQTMSNTIRSFSTLAPMELRITKKEMEKKRLHDTSEFAELDSYIEKVKNLNQEDSMSALQKNIVFLLEIYAYLYYCQQLLLEKESDKIFQKYL